MAQSNRSGSRCAASTMPALRESQTHAVRCHCCWITPLRRPRACRTSTNQGPSSSSSAVCPEMPARTRMPRAAAAAR
eukprot:10906357-Alexandrium_andersonii.AAC.1